MTVIKSGHIDIDNEPLIQKCREIATNTNRVTHGTDLFENVVLNHAWVRENPNDAPHNWPEFQPINQLIAELSGNTVPFRSWFNITSYGGQMREHIHHGAQHSVFVYYVRCLPEHPSIEFNEAGNWQDKNFRTGDWVYFPKDTLHRVGFSHSHQERISISVSL